MVKIREHIAIKWLTGIILLFWVSCDTREWNNPFDPDCPKEIFTPSNFTATQEGEQIILSWNQTNPNITGFKIERQVENESFSAIASPGKNENSVANTISAGGKLHTYKLYALAGSNKSNEVTASITPVLQAAVTTKAVTEITATSAISGGTIADDGGGPVIFRGVVWSTASNPTLENNDGKTEDGNGTGSFTSELTGLDENTNYFVKAYATNNRGTVYGNEVSFKTDQSVSLATVTTIFSNLTSTGAVVGGNVIDDGNTEVTERGVCWIWEPWGTQPTKQDSFKIVGSGPGEFSVELFYLESNTNYYVRAYAINETGISYGEIISFKTAKNLQAPTVYTSVPGEITTNSALLGGQVMDSGDTIVTERGIVYSLSENPTTADYKIEMGAGDGTFSGTISGLEPNTTYFVRAYAINSEGTGYGAQDSFTTSQLVSMATVTTTAVTTFTKTTAVLGGNVTNDGNATVIERGVVYATTQNPTTANTKVTIGTGTGIFSNTISGLTANTTYYVRAYVINSQGTAYGNEITFITIGEAPLIKTNAASQTTTTSAQLNGTVLANDTETIVTFEYGTTTSYGMVVTATQSPVAGNISTPVNAVISDLTKGTTYHYRIVATNSAGTTYGADITFITAYVIGEFQHGGYIFYIDETGEHGLVCAPSDQSNGAEWGCYMKSLDGASGITIGTGYQNTIDIVLGCPTEGIAAKICYDLVLNGFDDWYLPSKDELVLMYTNLKAKGLGGFANNYYWSSSEYANDDAWGLNFSNNYIFVPNKFNTYRVRAIRSF